MKRMIRFAAGPSEKKPYPIALADFRVTSGLFEDDGAYLIGFAERGQQTLSVMAEEGLKDPSLVLGKVPIFSNQGGFFNWDCVISSIETVEGGEKE